MFARVRLAVLLQRRCAMVVCRQRFSAVPIHPAAHANGNKVPTAPTAEGASSIDAVAGSRNMGSGKSSFSLFWKLRSAEELVSVLEERMDGAVAHDLAVAMLQFANFGVAKGPKAVAAIANSLTFSKLSARLADTLILQQLDDHDLANVVKGLAVFKKANAIMLQCLQTEIRKRLRHLSPSVLVTLFVGMWKIDPSMSTLFSDMTNLVVTERGLRHVSPAQLTDYLRVTIATNLYQGRCQDDIFFSLLRNKDKMTPSQMCTCLRLLVTVSRSTNRAIFEEYAKRIAPGFMSLDNKDLTNFVIALRMHNAFHHRDDTPRYVAELTSRLPTLSVQQIRWILFAVKKGRYPEASAFFEQAMQELENRLHSLRLVEVASDQNELWLEEEGDSTFRAPSSAVDDIVPSTHLLSIFDMYSITYSASEHHVKNKSLIHAFCDLIAKTNLILTLPFHYLPPFTVALAKLYIRHEPLLGQISDCIRLETSHCLTEHVHSLLYAFGLLHYSNLKIFDKFSRNLLQGLQQGGHLSEIQLQRLSSSTAALSRTHYYAPVLLQTCVDVFLQKGDMRKDFVSFHRFVRSFSHFDLASSSLTAAAVEHMKTVPKLYDPIVLGWYLLSRDSLDVAGAERVFHSILNHERQYVNSPRKLYDIIDWYRMTVSADKATSHPIFNGSVYKSIVEECTKQPEKSAEEIQLQDSIAAVLTDLGVAYSGDVTDPVSLYRIPLLVENGKKTAICLITDADTAVNDRSIPLESVVGKCRGLQRHAYTVLQICSREWFGLQETSARKQWLATALKE